MIVVKDKQMRKIGKLENANSIGVERRVNELWTASFSLPKKDVKNNLCSHLNYIEITSPSGRYMGLYRIMPTETRKSIGNNQIVYKCEHVFATLLDDVIDGYLQFTNFSTKQVIERLLNLQSTKRWVIGKIEIERGFHYKFENENGLLAPILSIPKPFDEPYEFTFDTQTYPWKLNLVRPSDKVTGELRWGKDMIDFEEVSDPTDIVNYLVPKGAGEGVNQLTIADVNGGRRYLQDNASIAKWGKRSYIWIDRRFTDKESLKASGQSLLNQWKDPKISFACKSVDLSIKPEYAHEKKLLNGVINILVDDNKYRARIISEKIPDLNKEWDVDYEINNKLDDIATTQTDLERKQQVNDAYSQGATNADSYSYHDNCDQEFPALVEFPFPDDMINVNESVIRIKTSRFRAYTRGSEAGGSYIKESQIEASTTEGGGDVTSGPSSRETSESGGGGTSGPSSRTTSGPSSRTTSGPSSRTTSAAGGDHRHLMIKSNGNSPSDSPSLPFYPYQIRTGSGQTVSANLPTLGSHDIYTFDSSGNHSHSMDHTHAMDHTHTMDHNHTVPVHTHKMDHTHDMPKHSHDFKVTIPAIEIPDHTHPQIYGVYEHDKMPSKLTVKIDGIAIPFNGIEGEIDITEYLKKDDQGKITRGYHTIEVSPNDLARISLIVRNRFFIQSQIGGTF